MGRRFLPKRTEVLLSRLSKDRDHMRYYLQFPGVIPLFGADHQRVTHPFATKKHPVINYRMLSVRLACIRHAASVNPEPGSNSPQKKASEDAVLRSKELGSVLLLSVTFQLSRFHRSGQNFTSRTSACQGLCETKNRHQ
jgi:hypothetical protein